MSEILVKEKDIVVPGELLAKGMDNFPGSGTYRENEEIYASRVGIVYIDRRAIKVIPMSGVYMPKVGDVVIGNVVDLGMYGWRLEINSAYSCVLSLKDATSEYIAKGDDLTQYYEIGDYMVVKISNVTSQKLVDIKMREPGLKKLKGGRIFKVNTNKVPRIIGKKGPMVSMIKNATGCRITVGQNGLVWIQGDPENEFIVIDAIKKIEKESHLSGLTNRVKEFLEERTGKKVETPSFDDKPNESQSFDDKPSENNGGESQ